MKHVKINISTDFSLMPFGRYASDGNDSGERLRDELLVPLIKNNDAITIVLDGVFAYGSSFLSEAFGELNKYGISNEELKAKIKLISDDDIELGERVRGFIFSR
jgi:hypothetical protein